MLCQFHVSEKTAGIVGIEECQSPPDFVFAGMEAFYSVYKVIAVLRVLVTDFLHFKEMLSRQTHWQKLIFSHF